MIKTNQKITPLVVFYLLACYSPTIISVITSIIVIAKV